MTRPWPEQRHGTLSGLGRPPRNPADVGGFRKLVEVHRSVTDTDRYGGRAAGGRGDRSCLGVWSCPSEDEERTGCDREGRSLPDGGKMAKCPQRELQEGEASDERSQEGAQQPRTESPDGPEICGVTVASAAVSTVKLTPSRCAKSRSSPRRT